MKKIAILLPCFNEGKILNNFNNLLVNNLIKLPFKFDLIYINDGSLDNSNEIIKCFSNDFSNININLIDLKYNMGHQGAIYQGFIYVKDLFYDNVLIMDTDGEDAPEAIEEILKHIDYDLVQVVRGKRNESLFFRFFYFLYKSFFVLIINKKLNFGNFCLIKPKMVNAALEYSFSHLAAFLDNQRCTKKQITWDRSKRIDGKSKMNFTSLFYHAVNSFVENAQNLLFVFIKLSIIIVIGILFLTGIILYKKYFTHVAIPGWSSSLLVALLNSLLITLGVFVIGALQLNILSKQNSNKIEKQFTSYFVVSNWKQ